MLFQIGHFQPALFLWLLMFSFSSVHSQTRLEGTVADKKTGEPIPFVHLVVKNKLTGTASNADGIFRIDISGLTDKDSLKITHLNYSPIARKDQFTKNSLYKAGTHFTSEFWRSINIPLLTKEETKLLQELESRGIPVKGK
jgi:hypothetical protein